MIRKADISRIYNDLKAPLHNFLWQWCQNENDIQDVIQDTFVKVIDSRKQYEQGSASIKTWVFTIAKHTLFRRFRKRAKPVDIEELKENGMAFPATAPLADECLDKKNRIAAIEGKIDDMKPLRAQALRLYAIENLSYKEIAEKQNIEIGTVKSRIARAREQL